MASIEPLDEEFTLVTESIISNTVETAPEKAVTSPHEDNNKELENGGKIVSTESPKNSMEANIHSHIEVMKDDNFGYKITRMEKVADSLSDLSLNGQQRHVTDQMGTNSSEFQIKMATGLWPIVTEVEPSTLGTLKGAETTQMPEIYTDKTSSIIDEKTTLISATISSTLANAESNNTSNAIVTTSPHATLSTVTVPTTATTVAVSTTTASSPPPPPIAMKPALDLGKEATAVEEFYHRELLLLQLMRQQQQGGGGSGVNGVPGLTSWLSALPPSSPPAAAATADGGSSFFPAGWGALLSIPITLLFVVLIFLLHRRLQRRRGHRQQPVTQRMKQQRQSGGGRPADNSEHEAGDDDAEEDDLYEYPTTVLSHGGGGGSAPALYHSLSRNAQDKAGGGGEQRSTPPQRHSHNNSKVTAIYAAHNRRREPKEPGPTVGEHSHTYVSVPDVVSTSLIAANVSAAGGAMPLDDTDGGCDCRLLDSAGEMVTESVEEIGGAGGDRTPKTGFVRNTRGRYSLLSSSRRWKSEDWDSDENLFSTLAMKLRRKQSRPEITEL
jgi:hypothetical protein